MSARTWPEIPAFLRRSWDDAVSYLGAGDDRRANRRSRPTLLAPQLGLVARDRRGVPAAAALPPVGSSGGGGAPARPAPRSAPRTTEEALARHLAAQAGGKWQVAYDELRAGYKESCWSWYVFPCPRSPQRPSELSRYFALRDLVEARAYLAHPVLGPRWRAARDEVLRQVAEGNSLVNLLGPLDAPKFRAAAQFMARAARSRDIVAQESAP